MLKLKLNLKSRIVKINILNKGYGLLKDMKQLSKKRRKINLFYVFPAAAVVELY